MIFMERRLEVLKLLLGITNDKKDGILERIMEGVSEYICRYCGIDTVTDDMEGTYFAICIHVYRYERLGDENGAGNIKSITEGDVSISFDTQEWKDRISGFKEELNYFRRAAW